MESKNFLLGFMKDKEIINSNVTKIKNNNIIYTGIRLKNENDYEKENDDTENNDTMKTMILKHNIKNKLADLFLILILLSFIFILQLFF